VRRIKLTAVLTIPLLAVALGSVPAGSAAPVPGPPTSVRAISVAGSPGVTVSWNAPASDGGSAIEYYVATTYSGKHHCVSTHPGAGSCFIAGLNVESGRPAIRVRAVSAHGRGTVVVTPVTQGAPDAGTAATTPTATSPTGVSATIPTTPAAASASQGTGTSANAATPNKLPFTGADVEALLILGVILTVAGLALVSSIGRRRRTRWPTADRLLRQ
jgi:hypothetical protein